MIDYKEGNLLEAEVEALVNTVNCVGIMGKGVALQFKQAFPNNFKEYAKACKTGEVQLCKVFIVQNTILLRPKLKYIINFPTKDHWKSKSRLSDIKCGLDDLIAKIQKLNITSVALPPLGCGNGGLEWEEVRVLIETAFEQIPTVQAWVYAPQTAPQPHNMPVNTNSPNLTLGRALLIRLLEIYQTKRYLSSALEVQKLAYFLQEAGQPLKLRYVKQQYGPYADNLNHVLQVMEGHFTRGYGDRNIGAKIHLLPNAVEKANQLLQNQTEANTRLKRVQQLIDGFETPYSMELLATVHWITQEDAGARFDKDLAIVKFGEWNERKRTLFKASHIAKAWEHLQKEGWLGASGELNLLDE